MVLNTAVGIQAPFIDCSITDAARFSLLLGNGQCRQPAVFHRQKVFLPGQWKTDHIQGCNFGIKKFSPKQNFNPVSDPF